MGANLHQTGVEYRMGCFGHIEHPSLHWISLRDHRGCVDQLRAPYLLQQGKAEILDGGEAAQLACRAP